MLECRTDSKQVISLKNNISIISIAQLSRRSKAKRRRKKSYFGKIIAFCKHYGL